MSTDRRSERGDRERLIVDRERDRIAQRALARKSDAVSARPSYARRDASDMLRDRERDRDVVMSDASVVSERTSYSRTRDRDDVRSSWKAGLAEDVPRWTPERVSKWLVEQGMTRHAAVFSRHQIDGATLIALTSSDLQDELRITSLGERKQLMSMIKGLGGHSGGGSPSGAGYAGERASIGGGSVDMTELTRAMEAETSVVQSVIQSEVRRATATLKHDIAQLSAEVVRLQKVVQSSGEGAATGRAGSTSGVGLRLFTNAAHASGRRD